ncbi:MAG: SH3 domain-containing protein [Candidatus Binataceae bacterium]
MAEEVEGGVARPRFTGERTIAVAGSWTRRRRLILPAAMVLNGAAALIMVLAAVPAAFAQLGCGLPRTTITSDQRDVVRSPARSSEGHNETAGHRASNDNYQRGRGTPALKFHVAPAKARLTLKTASLVYEEPAKSSKALARLPAGGYLEVSGATHYFLRIKLNHGRVGYVPISAVNMITPADKIHRLAMNAAVLSTPAIHGAKLSEVHRGHDVHIVGVTLNYVRIRMRSGLEGFIPVSALQ